MKWRIIHGIATAFLFCWAGAMWWTQRERETELAEARAMHEFIRETGGAMMFINSRGDIVEWSDGATNLLGYTETEVFGKSLTFMMRPQVREQHQAAFDKAVSAWPKHDVHIKCSVVHKDGHLLDVFVKVKPFRRDGDGGGKYGAIIWER